ncbi:hypothetical protein, partial [Petrotoga sp. 9T1HF07.CasAA.8.2]|uniref:hypothetical protein n=1 Tax=Petrotoga sp. 9T1HF07.CasAA.8.2 TaxID=1434329 RepID=UPI001E59AFC3
YIISKTSNYDLTNLFHGHVILSNASPFKKSQGYDIICLQCCANKDLLKREIFVFGEFEGVYPLKDSNYDLTNLFSQISYMV